jgi:hypothetical protein
MKFRWGKIPYTECCARRDYSGTVLLIKRGQETERS